jgi:ubiquinol-cytochrome c reductase cytochrome c subunit
VGSAPGHEQPQHHREHDERADQGIPAGNTAVAAPGIPRDRQRDEGDDPVQHVEGIGQRTAGERQRQAHQGREKHGDDQGEDGAVQPARRHADPDRGGYCCDEGPGRRRRRDPREDAMEPCHGEDGSALRGPPGRDQRGHRVTTSPSRQVAGGWVILAALVVGALAVVGTARGVAAGPATATVPGDSVGQAAIQEAGRGLYTQSCASCHGPQGEGAEAGPSLIGTGAASTSFYLRTGRMPLGAPGQRPVRQQPQFTEEEIQALVEYVAGFGPGPDIPQVQAGGDIRRGWELYTANCAACHAATGAGNAVGGGFAAYGLALATPQEIAEAMLIGPGVMPRFDFSQEDQDAILAYVEYLRTMDSPGGLPILGIGPVAEGFVAVLVGLTTLVLVARFVGRRTHEGEPEVPLPAPNLPEDVGHGNAGERA